jgi:acid phosphatase type 7
LRQGGGSARAAAAHGTRLRRLFLLAGALSIGVVVAAAFTASAATVSLAPTDDTYSKSDSPSSTSGGETSISVDGDPIRHGYLRFNVDGLDGPVSRATLQIYALTSHSKGFDVRAVSSAWTESTLTATNAPSPAEPITASSGPLVSNTWKTFDVTPLVGGNGVVAIALTPISTTNLRVASKEGGPATAPQLTVETGPSASSSSSAATSTAPPPTTTAPPPTTTTAPPPPTTAPTTTTTTTTTTTAPPPSGTDPVIAVAGDIASDNTGDSATAALIDAIQPTAVLTTGDNAYPNGTAAEFASYYEPTWGRHKSMTFPSPGNHDYNTAGATGYYGYFGSRAGEPAKGYYSYDIGSWHLIALNSEIKRDSNSPQLAWLKSDLAATTAQCVLAYWHKPRFSAGSYSDRVEFQPFWDALYAANADLVLNGHDHNYQRYQPMTPTGVRDDTRGLREIVVGTGGKGPNALKADARREAGDGGTRGVLKLTLRPEGYDWAFVPEAGKTFTDSGSSSCH